MAVIVSKLYCSQFQENFVVRTRAPVVGGGGFVVMNCNQEVVFRVDGCGTLGVKGVLLLNDTDGEPLLLIRRQGGVVQALSVNPQWKGYKFDYEGEEKLVFSVKEPVVFLAKKVRVKIMLEPRHRDWDFEVRGSFPDRACSIVDSGGNTVAQIGIESGVQGMISSKDLYHVVVQPGIDQAFVFGVIAILDNIHGESTRC